MLYKFLYSIFITEHGRHESYQVCLYLILSKSKKDNQMKGGKFF